MNAKDSASLNELVDFGETLIGHRFVPGANPAVRCIRLTIDPVFATQRPLIYYMAIATMSLLGKAVLWYLDFRKQYIKGQVL